MLSQLQEVIEYAQTTAATELAMLDDNVAALRAVRINPDNYRQGFDNSFPVQRATPTPLLRAMFDVFIRLSTQSYRDKPAFEVLDFLVKNSGVAEDEITVEGRLGGSRLDSCAAAEPWFLSALAQVNGTTHDDVER